MEGYIVPAPWHEVVCDICNDLHTQDDTRTGGAVLYNSWALCPECCEKDLKMVTARAAEGQTFFDFITQVRKAQGAV